MTGRCLFVYVKGFVKEKKHELSFGHGYRKHMVIIWARNEKGQGQAKKRTDR